MIARNIISNWVGLLVAGIVTIILTPFMIHHLGNFGYGMWVLAGSILDYYGLLDLGMRSAVFRFVARFRGAADRQALDETFASALALTLGIAGIVCLLSLGLAGELPKFFSLASSSRGVFSLLILLLGFSIAIVFPTRLLATYLSAHQRWDLYNVAGIATTVARAILIVVVLKIGQGVTAVAIVTLIVSLVSFVAHSMLVRAIDPLVCIDLRRTRWARIRELFGFSVNSSLLMVGDSIRFYSDSLVIAKVLAVSLVTPFSIPARLMEFFKSIIVAAGGPVLGSMSELDGQARDHDLRNTFLLSTRLMALLSCLGGGLLLADGKTLIRLWVGKDLVSSYPILVVLTVAYVTSLAQHPSLLVAIARARHGPLGGWTVAEGIANLVLSIYWARHYGLVGVALGTAVPMLVVKLAIQPWYALSAVQMGWWEYLKDAIARPAIVFAMFLAIAWLATPGDIEMGPLAFAWTVLWHSLVYVTLAVFVGLTSSERRQLFSRGQSAVLRFSRQ